MTYNVLMGTLIIKPYSLTHSLTHSLYNLLICFFSAAAAAADNDDDDDDDSQDNGPIQLFLADSVFNSVVVLASEG